MEPHAYNRPGPRSKPSPGDPEPRAVCHSSCHWQRRSGRTPLSRQCRSTFEAAQGHSAVTVHSCCSTAVPVLEGGGTPLRLASYTTLTEGLGPITQWQVRRVARRHRVRGPPESAGHTEAAGSCRPASPSPPHSGDPRHKKPATGHRIVQGAPRSCTPFGGATGVNGRLKP